MVTVFVMLMVAGLVLLISATSGAAPQPRAVEVHRGDTLWSIAERYAPSGDPVATIEQIRHLNHLSGFTIYPGQTLLVPASS